MGASYSGYTADVTVSFPANGKFTDNQRAIYNTVLRASRAVLNAIKPGIFLDVCMLYSQSNRTSGGCNLREINALELINRQCNNCFYLIYSKAYVLSLIFLINSLIHFFYKRNVKLCWYFKRHSNDGINNKWYIIYNRRVIKLLFIMYFSNACFIICIYIVYTSTSITSIDFYRYLFYLHSFQAKCCFIIICLLSLH